MQETEIAEAVLARVRQRRGSLHLYETIDPRRTAHVVVNLQNGFMAPGEIATAREIVPTSTASAPHSAPPVASWSTSRAPSTRRPSPDGAFSSIISAPPTAAPR